MVSKLITQTAVWIAAMAAVLFVAAGTGRWPAAWVFLAEMAGLGLAIGLWLARRDPALLAERLTAGFQAAQKPGTRCSWSRCSCCGRAGSC
jgi:hypothetical protein